MANNPPKLSWVRWAGAGEAGYDRQTDKRVFTIYRRFDGCVLYKGQDKVGKFITDTIAKRKAEELL
jgi:hypothetical protein